MNREKIRSLLVGLRPGPKTKRALKITAIVVSVLAVVLAVTPIVFRNKIANNVRAKLNSMCNARVEFSDIEVSFFRHFPRVTVDVHNLRMTGVGEYEGRELASIERFEMTMSMPALCGSSVEIKEMWLHKPRLVVEVVGENGETVWDSVKFRRDGIVRSQFTFDAVHMCDATLIYRDERRNNMVSDVVVGPFDMTFSGSVREANSFVSMNVDIERVEVMSDGDSYTTKRPLNIKCELGYTNCEKRYALNNCSLSIGDFEAIASGTMQVGASPASDLDVEFRGEGFEHATVKVRTRGELLEDMHFDVSLAKARVADVAMERVEGSIAVQNGVLLVNRLSMELFGGHAQLTGKCQMTDEGPVAEVQGSIDGADVQRTFVELGALKSNPMLESLSGHYALVFDCVAPLDEGYYPCMERVSCNGELRSRDLRITDIPAPELLSKVLGSKVPDSAQLSAEAVMPFAMEQGRFKVYTTNLPFGDMSLRISGESRLDGALDFDIAIKFASLTLNGTVGGTMDNPQYSFDTSRLLKEVFSPKSIFDEVRSWF